MVYAGGVFTSIGGLTRKYIAALDSSGVPTSWNPERSRPVICPRRQRRHGLRGRKLLPHRWADAQLPRCPGFFGHCLPPGTPTPTDTVSPCGNTGSTVYAGGDFTNIGGQTRNYLAAIDASGVRHLLEPQRQLRCVNALAVTGARSTPGGSSPPSAARRAIYLAALDSSGAATSWNPNANWRCVRPGGKRGTIYAGGTFHQHRRARRAIASLPSDSSAGTCHLLEPQRQPNTL